MLLVPDFAVCKHDVVLPDLRDRVDVGHQPPVFGVDDVDPEKLLAGVNLEGLRNLFVGVPVIEDALELTIHPQLTVPADGSQSGILKSEEPRRDLPAMLGGCVENVHPDRRPEGRRVKLAGVSELELPKLFRDFQFAIPRRRRANGVRHHAKLAGESLSEYGRNPCHKAPEGLRIVKLGDKLIEDEHIHPGSVEARLVIIRFRKVEKHQEGFLFLLEDVPSLVPVDVAEGPGLFVVLDVVPASVREIMNIPPAVIGPDRVEHLRDVLRHDLVLAAAHETDLEPRIAFPSTHSEEDRLRRLTGCSGRKLDIVGDGLPRDLCRVP